MSTILRTELKLLLRHWGVWVVAAGGLFLAYDVGQDGSMATLPFWIDESFLRFFLLGPLLLTVTAARRPQSDRVDELIRAMPYRPAPWVLGRFLAGYLVWLCLSVSGWVLVGGLFVLRGEPVDLGALAGHWLVSAPVSVAVATAVGFALGHLPGGSLVGFVGAMAYYFMGVAVPMLSRQPAVFLDYVAPQHWLPLSVAGYFPNGGLVLYNRLFAAGLAGALISGVLWLIARRRRMPWLAAVLALVLAVGMATVGLAGSQRELAGRERQAAAEEAAWAALPPLSAVGGTLVADRYDLHAVVEPDVHLLSTRGSFDLTNISGRRLEQLDLTLRANFGVVSVADQEGRPLTYTRVGDALTVATPLEPGESIRLSMGWAGRVWQWQSTGTAMTYWGTTLGAHVAADSLLLPATFGWYPLPVRGHLTNDDLPPDVPPARFALQISGTDLRLITNAGNEAVPGLYLVGTRLRPEQVGGVEVYAAEADRGHVKGVLDVLRSRALVIGEPLELTRVIELPTASRYGWESGLEQRATPGAVLVRGRDIAAAAGGDLEREGLGAFWWGDPRAPLGVRGGVALYLDWVTTGKQWSDRHDPVSDAARCLLALERARGREIALDLVRSLRQKPPATPEAFRGAVVAVAAEDPETLKGLTSFMQWWER